MTIICARCPYNEINMISMLKRTIIYDTLNETKNSGAPILGYFRSLEPAKDN